MCDERSSGEIQERYARAQKEYAAAGVETELAVVRAAAVPVSLHCWQGDDITGFEAKAGAPGGGLLATGNCPGRARNGDELRADLEQVLALVPGTHRVNTHAFYAETDGAIVERDALEPRHFARWVAWAKARGLALDFNATYFSHPLAAGGFTLSHRDESIRRFWVRHGIACRRIAAHFAAELGSPSIHNHWIPDGMKDSPADRWSPRKRLVESLDAILDPALGIDPRKCVDSVEGKLFGLGSEDYVVGSFEFYSCYALRRGMLLCLDMGHFHPTETIYDKLSALLQFHPRLLLHLSRGLRWDSDHVVLLNDDMRAVFLELVRGQALDRVALALDYFDPSINRIAAYVIGARAVRKAILAALLEPSAELRELELAGRNAQKMALLEDQKDLPFGAVWDELCRRAGVPGSRVWIREVEGYEREVLSKR